MARIRCGQCKGTHGSVEEVKDCYRDDRYGYLNVRDAEAEFAAQQAGEIWAEGAWLRHAEGWYRMPDPEDERDRMAEAYGYGWPS